MIKDYTLRTEIECSAEREARLQKEWEKTLPCFGCEFSQLCKFKGMLKRPNYDPSVFNFTIECNVVGQLRETVVNNAICKPSPTP